MYRYWLTTRMSLSGLFLSRSLLLYFKGSAAKRVLGEITDEAQQRKRDIPHTPPRSYIEIYMLGVRLSRFGIGYPFGKVSVIKYKLSSTFTLCP